MPNEINMEIDLQMVIREAFIVGVLAGRLTPEIEPDQLAAIQFQEE